MGTIFKKRPGRLQSSLTAKLLAGIEYIQRRWANYMNAKTAHLSRRQYKIFFLSFCFLFALANSCVLYQSLTQKERPHTRPAPARTTPLLPAAKERDAVLTQREKTALRFLRQRLDSLSATPEGKAQIDAFLATHQGFADSLRKAEELIR